MRKWDWRGKNSRCNPTADKNPGRGFYHVYTYDITQKEAEEDWIWSLCKDERLALVLLDIGKCAHRALTDGELAKAGRIFSLFRDNGMQMIVRVVYDRVGRGMEHEPGEIGQVVLHMRQLGPLLAAFSAHILTAQGLFIGSWGEMHDSRFLEKEQLFRLYETFREAAQGVRISVRKPQQQRILQMQNTEDAVGLYDDAILASGTDMGTFGWIDDVQNREIMWTPERELEFMQVQNRRALCGGEVLAGALIHSADEVLARLSLMQATYLNSVHEPIVWERWRVQRYPEDGSGEPNSTADGARGGREREGSCVAEGNGTLYGEIRVRLGYRYELAEVEIVGGGPGRPASGARKPDAGRKAGCGRLRIAIRNTGFACCYDPVRVILSCGSMQLAEVFDGRALAAGASIDVWFDIFDMKEACAGQEGDGLPLFVALRHEPTGLPIYFSDGACPSTDPARWERYRSISSLSEGTFVGVLLRVKEESS